MGGFFMIMEEELSLEQILAKLQAEGKKITPGKIARIEENLRQRDTRAASRREDSAVKAQAMRMQAIAASHALREFARGGVVDRNGSEIVGVFERKIRLQGPVGFVLFIGAGDKSYGDTYDKRLKERVVSLLEAANQHHSQGVKLHVILADEHVRRNGYIDASGKLLESTVEYFTGAAQDFRSIQRPGVDVEIVYLSKLYESHGLSPMTEERALRDKDAERVYWRHMSSLNSNARRHSRTGMEESVDAIRYVAMRMQEREILARSFPNTILLAPGVSTGAQDIILPKSHTAIFIGGKSPWFLKGGEKR